MSKISSAVWNEIISRKINGEKAANLAKEFNIGESTIYEMIRKRKQSCIDLSSYVEIKINSNDFISFKLNNYQFQVLKTDLREFLGALND